MPTRMRIRFYQQMATLARAGVPMRTTLTRLQERIRHEKIRTLAQEVEAGEPIGAAFARAGFTPFETHLVEAGERSGQLESVFAHLAAFWERDLEMRDALISQLTYPLVVLHIGLLVNFLPVLLFHSLDDFIKSLIFWLCLIYGCGTAAYFIVIESWRSSFGQKFWMIWPLFGPALSTTYAYRWITALRLEFSAGIPLPQAVADAWRATGYAERNKLATQAEASLREGVELSVLMEAWRQLPRDWLDFIETGEIAGELEKTFKTLENEAGYAWALAQQRMRDWVPKLLYFAMMLLVAYQIYDAARSIALPDLNELDQVNKIIDQNH